MSNLNNLIQQGKTSSVSDGYDGFEDLSKIVSEYINGAENSHEALVAGAQAFVTDLKKLTKPYSKIHSSGYTHLIRTFAYSEVGKEVVVGWGKYYGRIVENGWSKKGKSYAGRAHLRPTFEKNKDKYYTIMLKKLNIK